MRGIQLTIEGADRAVYHFFLNEGRFHALHVTSPYLISAGQDIVLNVVARVVDQPTVTHHLRDATHLRDETDVALVEVPIVWDVSFIPTRRSLPEILADAVQHGIDEPTHGINCICMDQFAREIRLQVSKALPPDGRTTDSDWSQPIRERVMSKARVKHVLDMVLRGF